MERKKQTSLLSILSQKHFPLAYLPWETRKRDPPSLCEKNEMQIDHNTSSPLLIDFLKREKKHFRGSLIQNSILRSVQEKLAH